MIFLVVPIACLWVAVHLCGLLHLALTGPRARARRVCRRRPPSRSRSPPPMAQKGNLDLYPDPQTEDAYPPIRGDLEDECRQALLPGTHQDLEGWELVV